MISFVYFPMVIYEAIYEATKEYKMDLTNLVTTQPKAVRCLTLTYNCVAGRRAEGEHLNKLNVFILRSLTLDLPQTLLISTVAVSEAQGDPESELLTLINLESLRGGGGEAVGERNKDVIPRDSVLANAKNKAKVGASSLTLAKEAAKISRAMKDNVVNMMTRGRGSITWPNMMMMMSTRILTSHPGARSQGQGLQSIHSRGGQFNPSVSRGSQLS